MTVLAVAVNPVAAAAADGDAPRSRRRRHRRRRGRRRWRYRCSSPTAASLRLAAILVAPKALEPLAAAARAALADAVGRALVLEFGPRRTDRHGRQLAQAWLAAAGGTKGAWLQEMLLTRGLARVASTDDTRRPGAGAAADRSAGARRPAAACGPIPPIASARPPMPAMLLDSFQIVEGRVAGGGPRAQRRLSQLRGRLQDRLYAKLQPRGAPAPAGERHRLQVAARRSPARPRLAEDISMAR